MVGILRFPLQGAQVQSLVGELGSLKLRGTAKKKKKVHTYIDIIYRGLCIYRFLVYNFFSDISKILAVPRPKGQNTRKNSIPGV